MVDRTLSIHDVLGVPSDVELKHAPAQFFVRGDVDLLRQGPRVAVVGSRQATPMGLSRAAALTQALVRHHMIVVSGLAEGIDTAAHTAALEHGGRTIAVIGTPLSQSYPRSNRELQARIGTEHLLISQFAEGTPVTPKNFPIRNRTMALLSDATVIVEASESSGTIHQGWEALRLGRQLFLLANVANNEALSWPKELIHYGAQVLSNDNVDVVLDALPAVTAGRQDDLRDIA